MKELFDHVFELKPYTALDYDFVDRFHRKNPLDPGGHCTAAARVTESGQMLVGRNMDLNISHKPAFVIRTQVPGDYETIGLSYYFKIIPDYKDIRQNGLSEDIQKLLPFLCTDVLNSEGLYIETNMRSGEVFPDGSSKFGCTGTNPDAAISVSAGCLPRYLIERCATVEEALAYAKELNLYTAQNNPAAWNFCFLMADASGHHGVLEVASNQLFWHESAPVQTNFYLEPELYAREELRCGLGRYETVIKKLSSVQNEADMYALIRSVSYFQIYSPDKCRFDWRSEFAGLDDFYSFSELTDDTRREEIQAAVVSRFGYIPTLPREKIMDMNACWESTFSEVINCNEKTLMVRFFEDDAKMLRLSF